jgi:hypothetical protein
VGVAELAGERGVRVDLDEQVGEIDVRELGFEGCGQRAGPW